MRTLLLRDADTGREQGGAYPEHSRLDLLLLHGHCGGFSSRIMQLLRNIFMVNAPIDQHRSGVAQPTYPLAPDYILSSGIRSGFRSAAVSSDMRAPSVASETLRRGAFVITTWSQQKKRTRTAMRGALLSSLLRCFQRRPP
jgi:hypothetical protein